MSSYCVSDTSAIYQKKMSSSAKTLKSRAVFDSPNQLNFNELIELITGKKSKLTCDPRKLADKTVWQIQQMGFTEATAIKIGAAIQLGRIAHEPIHPYLNDEISTPAAAALALSSKIYGDVEKFGILSLNTSNRLLSIDLITIGSKQETLAPPSEIFRRAIIKGATRLIVGHNHPSGSLNPSPEDLDLTKQLLSCAKKLDLPMLDHLILGVGGMWQSLRQTSDLWVQYEKFS